MEKGGREKIMTEARIQSDKTQSTRQEKTKKQKEGIRA